MATQCPDVLDVGDDATTTYTLTVNGALTDATAATLTVDAPDGTVSTPTVTHVSLGLYSAVIPVTQAGQWRYRWTSTGTAKASEEGSFLVRRRAVP